jgi:hypothetical protein
MMSLDDLKQGHEDAKRMRRYQKKKQRSNRRKPKHRNKKEKFTDGEGDDNKTMDLRDFYTLPPVLDQGSYGTCVSNAGSCAISLLLFQNGYITTYGSPPSRLFLHFNSRVMGNTDRTKTFQTKLNLIGTRPYYMLRSLNLYAWCDEVAYPYTSEYAAPPDPNIYIIASKNMKYEINVSLINTESVNEFISTAKNALNNHDAFIIFIPIYESSDPNWFFCNLDNGRLTVPNSTCKVESAHCMLCIGFTVDAFIMQNSWGMTGNAGFYYVPFDYFSEGKKLPDFLVYAFVMEDIVDTGDIRTFPETQMEFSLSFVPQLEATSKKTFYSSSSMFDFYSSSIYERAAKLKPPLLCTTPLTCTTQSTTPSTTPSTKMNEPLYLAIVPEDIYNGPAAFIKVTTVDATTITIDHFVPAAYQTVVTYDNVTNMLLTQSPTTIKCKNVKSIALRKSTTPVFSESQIGIYLGSTYTSAKDHGYRLSDLKLDKMQKAGEDFLVFTLKVNGVGDSLPNILAVATKKAYDDTEAHLEVNSGKDWGGEMGGQTMSNTNKKNNATTNYFVWRGIRLQKDGAIRVTIREQDVTNALGEGNQFVYALAVSTTGAIFAGTLTYNQDCAGYFENPEDCPIGCGQYEGRYTRASHFKVTQESIGEGRKCPYYIEIRKCPATPSCTPSSTNT